MQITVAPRRAWLRLPAGAHLDLNDPTSHAGLDVTVFGRAAFGIRAGLTAAVVSPPWPPVGSRMALLHDAEEGFWGFDCIAQLKGMRGQAYHDVSDRLGGDFVEA